MNQLIIIYPVFINSYILVYLLVSVGIKCQKLSELSYSRICTNAVDVHFFAQHRFDHFTLWSREIGVRKLVDPPLFFLKSESALVLENFVLHSFTAMGRRCCIYANCLRSFVSLLDSATNSPTYRQRPTKVIRTSYRIHDPNFLT